MGFRSGVRDVGSGIVKSLVHTGKSWVKGKLTNKDESQGINDMKQYNAYQKKMEVADSNAEQQSLLGEMVDKDIINYDVRKPASAKNQKLAQIFNTPRMGESQEVFDEMDNLSADIRNRLTQVRKAHYTESTEFERRIAEEGVNQLLDDINFSIEALKEGEAAVKNTGAYEKSLARLEFYRDNVDKFYDSYLRNFKKTQNQVSAYKAAVKEMPEAAEKMGDVGLENRRDLNFGAIKNGRSDLYSILDGNTNLSNEEMDNVYLNTSSLFKNLVGWAGHIFNRGIDAFKKNALGMHEGLEELMSMGLYNPEESGGERTRQFLRNNVIELADAAGSIAAFVGPTAIATYFTGGMATAGSIGTKAASAMKFGRLGTFLTKVGFVTAGELAMDALLYDALAQTGMQRITTPKAIQENMVFNLPIDFLIGLFSSGTSSVIPKYLKQVLSKGGNIEYISTDTLKKLASLAGISDEALRSKLERELVQSIKTDQAAVSSWMTAIDNKTMTKDTFNKKFTEAGMVTMNDLVNGTSATKLDREPIGTLYNAFGKVQKEFADDTKAFGPAERAMRWSELEKEAGLNRFKADGGNPAELIKRANTSAMSKNEAMQYLLADKNSGSSIAARSKAIRDMIDLDVISKDEVLKMAEGKGSTRDLANYLLSTQAEKQAMLTAEAGTEGGIATFTNLDRALQGDKRLINDYQVGSMNKLYDDVFKKIQNDPARNAKLEGQRLGIYYYKDNQRRNIVTKDVVESTEAQRQIGNTRLKLEGAGLTGDVTRITQEEQVRRLQDAGVIPSNFMNMDEKSHKFKYYNSALKEAGITIEQGKNLFGESERVNKTNRLQFQRVVESMDTISSGKKTFSEFGQTDVAAYRLLFLREAEAQAGKAKILIDELKPKGVKSFYNGMEILFQSRFNMKHLGKVTQNHLGETYLTNFTKAIADGRYQDAEAILYTMATDIVHISELQDSKQSVGKVLAQELKEHSASAITGTPDDQLVESLTNDYLMKKSVEETLGVKIKVGNASDLINEQGLSKQSIKEAIELKQEMNKIASDTTLSPAEQRAKFKKIANKLNGLKETISEADQEIAKAKADDFIDAVEKMKRKDPSWKVSESGYNYGESLHKNAPTTAGTRRTEWKYINEGDVGIREGDQYPYSDYGRIKPNVKMHAEARTRQLYTQMWKEAEKEANLVEQQLAELNSQKKALLNGDYAKKVKEEIEFAEGLKGDVKKEAVLTPKEIDKELQRRLTKRKLAEKEKLAKGRPALSDKQLEIRIKQEIGIEEALKEKSKDSTKRTAQEIGNMVNDIVTASHRDIDETIADLTEKQSRIRLPQARAEIISDAAIIAKMLEEQGYNGKGYLQEILDMIDNFSYERIAERTSALETGTISKMNIDKAKDAGFDHLIGDGALIFFGDQLAKREYQKEIQTFLEIKVKSAMENTIDALKNKEYTEEALGKYLDKSFESMWFKTNPYDITKQAPSLVEGADMIKKERFAQAARSTQEPNAQSKFIVDYLENNNWKDITPEEFQDLLKSQSSPHPEVLRKASMLKSKRYADGAEVEFAVPGAVNYEIAPTKMKMINQLVDEGVIRYNEATGSLTFVNDKNGLMHAWALCANDLDLAKYWRDADGKLLPKDEIKKQMSYLVTLYDLNVDNMQFTMQSNLINAVARRDITNATLQQLGDYDVTFRERLTQYKELVLSGMIEPGRAAGFIETMANLTRKASDNAVFWGKNRDKDVMGVLLKEVGDDINEASIKRNIAGIQTRGLSDQVFLERFNVAETAAITQATAKAVISTGVYDKELMIRAGRIVREMVDQQVKQSATIKQKARKLLQVSDKDGTSILDRVVEGIYREYIGINTNKYKIFSDSMDTLTQKNIVQGNIDKVAINVDNLKTALQGKSELPKSNLSEPLREFMEAFELKEGEDLIKDSDIFKDIGEYSAFDVEIFLNMSMKDQAEMMLDTLYGQTKTTGIPARDAFLEGMGLPFLKELDDKIVTSTVLTMLGKQSNLTDELLTKTIAKLDDVVAFLKTIPDPKKDYEQLSLTQMKNILNGENSIPTLRFGQTPKDALKTSVTDAGGSVVKFSFNSPGLAGSHAGNFYAASTGNPTTFALDNLVSSINDLRRVEGLGYKPSSEAMQQIDLIRKLNKELLDNVELEALENVKVSLEDVARIYSAAYDVRYDKVFAELELILTDQTESFGKKRTVNSRMGLAKRKTGAVKDELVSPGLMGSEKKVIGMGFDLPDILTKQSHIDDYNTYYQKQVDFFKRSLTKEKSIKYTGEEITLDNWFPIAVQTIGEYNINSPELRSVLYEAVDKGVDLQLLYAYGLTDMKVADLGQWNLNRIVSSILASTGKFTKENVEKLNKAIRTNLGGMEIAGLKSRDQLEYLINPMLKLYDKGLIKNFPNIYKLAGNDAHEAVKAWMEGIYKFLNSTTVEGSNKVISPGSGDINRAWKLISESYQASDIKQKLEEFPKFKLGFGTKEATTELKFAENAKEIFKTRESFENWLKATREVAEEDKEAVRSMSKDLDEYFAIDPSKRTREDEELLKEVAVDMQRRITGVEAGETVVDIGRVGKEGDQLDGATASMTRDTIDSSGVYEDVIMMLSKEDSIYDRRVEHYLIAPELISQIEATRTVGEQMSHGSVENAMFLAKYADPSTEFEGAAKDYVTNVMRMGTTESPHLVNEKVGLHSFLDEQVLRLQGTGAKMTVPIFVAVDYAGNQHIISANESGLLDGLGMFAGNRYKSLETYYVPVNVDDYIKKSGFNLDDLAVSKITIANEDISMMMKTPMNEIDKEVAEFLFATEHASDKFVGLTGQAKEYGAEFSKRRETFLKQKLDNQGWTKFIEDNINKKHRSELKKEMRNAGTVDKFNRAMNNIYKQYIDDIPMSAELKAFNDGRVKYAPNNIELKQFREELDMKVKDAVARSIKSEIHETVIKNLYDEYLNDNAKRSHFILELANNTDFDSLPVTVHSANQIHESGLFATVASSRGVYTRGQQGFEDLIEKMHQFKRQQILPNEILVSPSGMSAQVPLGYRYLNISDSPTNGFLRSDSGIKFLEGEKLNGRNRDAMSQFLFYANRARKLDPERVRSKDINWTPSQVISGILDQEVKINGHFGLFLPDSKEALTAYWDKISEGSIIPTNSEYYLASGPQNLRPLSEILNEQSVVKDRLADIEKTIKNGQMDPSARNNLDNEKAFLLTKYNSLLYEAQRHNLEKTHKTSVNKVVIDAYNDLVKARHAQADGVRDMVKGMLMAAKRGHSKEEIEAYIRANPEQVFPKYFQDKMVTAKPVGINCKFDIQFDEVGVEDHLGRDLHSYHVDYSADDVTRGKNALVANDMPFFDSFDFDDFINYGVKEDESGRLMKGATSMTSEEIGDFTKQLPEINYDEPIHLLMETPLGERFVVRAKIDPMNNQIYADMGMFYENKSYPKTLDVAGATKVETKVTPTSTTEGLPKQAKEMLALPVPKETKEGPVIKGHTTPPIKKEPTQVEPLKEAVEKNTLNKVEDATPNAELIEKPEKIDTSIVNGITEKMRDDVVQLDTEYARESKKQAKAWVREAREGYNKWASALPQLKREWFGKYFIDSLADPKSLRILKIFTNQDLIKHDIMVNVRTPDGTMKPRTLNVRQLIGLNESFMKDKKVVELLQSANQAAAKAGETSESAMIEFLERVGTVMRDRDLKIELTGDIAQDKAMLDTIYQNLFNVKVDGQWVPDQIHILPDVKNAVEGYFGVLRTMADKGYNIKPFLEQKPEYLFKTMQSISSDMESSIKNELKSFFKTSQTDVIRQSMSEGMQNGLKLTDKQARHYIRDLFDDGLGLGAFGKILSRGKLLYRLLKYSLLTPLGWAGGGLLLANNVLVGELYGHARKRLIGEAAKHPLVEKLLKEGLLSNDEILKSVKQKLAHEIMDTTSIQDLIERQVRRVEGVMKAVGAGDELAAKTGNFLVTGTLGGIHNLYDAVLGSLGSKKAIGEALYNLGYTEKAQLDALLKKMMDPNFERTGVVQAIYGEALKQRKNFFASSRQSSLARNRFSNHVRWTLMQGYSIVRADEIALGMTKFVRDIPFLLANPSKMLNYFQTENTELAYMLSSICQSLKLGNALSKPFGENEPEVDEAFEIARGINDLASAMDAFKLAQLFADPYRSARNVIEMNEVLGKETEVGERGKVAVYKFLDTVLRGVVREDKVLESPAMALSAFMQTGDFKIAREVFNQKTSSVANGLGRFNAVSPDDYGLYYTPAKSDFLGALLLNKNELNPALKRRRDLQDYSNMQEILNSDQKMVEKLLYAFPVIGRIGAHFKDNKKFNAVAYGRIQQHMQQDDVVRQIIDGKMPDEIFIKDGKANEQLIGNLFKDLTQFNYAGKTYLGDGLFEMYGDLDKMKEAVFTAELGKVFGSFEDMTSYIEQYASGGEKGIAKLIAMTASAEEGMHAPGATRALISYLANKDHYESMKAISGKDYPKKNDLSKYEQVGLEMDMVKKWYPLMDIVDKTSWYKVMQARLEQLEPQLLTKLTGDKNIRGFVNALTFIDMIVQQMSNSGEIDANHLKNIFTVIGKYVTDPDMRSLIVEQTLGSIGTLDTAPGNKALMRTGVLLGNIEFYHKLKADLETKEEYKDFLQKFESQMRGTQSDLVNKPIDGLLGDLAKAGKNGKKSWSASKGRPWMNYPRNYSPSGGGMRGASGGQSKNYPYGTKSKNGHKNKKLYNNNNKARNQFLNAAAKTPFHEGVNPSYNGPVSHYKTPMVLSSRISYDRYTTRRTLLPGGGVSKNLVSSSVRRYPGNYYSNIKYDPAKSRYNRSRRLKGHTPKPSSPAKKGRVSKDLRRDLPGG